MQMVQQSQYDSARQFLGGPSIKTHPRVNSPPGPGYSKYNPFHTFRWPLQIRNFMKIAHDNGFVGRGEFFHYQI